MNANSFKLARKLRLAVFAIVVLTLTACSARATREYGDAVAHQVGVLSERYRFVPPYVAVSPDGSLVAVRSADNQIKVWNWKRNQIVATLDLPPGANDSLSSGALKFSPDGNLLASCHGRGEDQTVVVVWETHAWTITHRIKDILPGSGCSAVEFTPDGKYLVRLLDRFQNLEGPTLVIYRTDVWREVTALRTNPFFGKVLAIHPDGKLLAVGGNNYPLGAKDDATAANSFLQFGGHASRIVILDLHSLKIIKSFTTNSKIGLWSTLAWSPDGSTILHAAGHGLQAINVDNEKEVFSTEASTGLAPGAAIYTANGLYLIEAQGRKSNILRIWDQAHRRLYQSFDGEFDAVAASADGQIIAATTTGKTLIFRIDPKKP